MLDATLTRLVSPLSDQAEPVGRSAASLPDNVVEGRAFYGAPQLKLEPAQP